MLHSYSFHLLPMFLNLFEKRRKLGKWSTCIRVLTLKLLVIQITPVIRVGLMISDKIGSSAASRKSKDVDANIYWKATNGEVEIPGNCS